MIYLYNFIELLVAHYKKKAKMKSNEILDEDLIKENRK